jgi:RNA polymerase sigma-70 factor (ECF subfamily)
MDKVAKSSDAPPGGQTQGSDDDADRALIERARRGDMEACELLMRRHNRRLYRVIRSVLRTDSEVEDTMQDTYLAALRNLDQFEGRSKFGTWLLKIATNAALARMRQRMRVIALDDLPDLDGPMMDLDAGVATPEQQVSSYEMVGIVEEAIDRLPYDYRQVFMLRTVEALDTEETADVLGLNEEAVRQRLHRAREMLQASIERQVGTAVHLAFGFLGRRCDRIVASVLRRMGEAEPDAQTSWN